MGRGAGTDGVTGLSLFASVVEIGSVRTKFRLLVREALTARD